MAKARHARHVVAEVFDLDLNLPVGGVLALPLAICSGVDHLRCREVLQRVGVVAFDPATALRKLRMQRAFHALGIPVEPTLDVVAHSCPDRILISAIGHWNLRLDETPLKRTYPSSAASVNAAFHAKQDYCFSSKAAALDRTDSPSSGTS